MHNGEMEDILRNKIRILKANNYRAVTYLRAYADELANRYKVETVPEYRDLLSLIAGLSGEHYTPKSWGR